MIPPLLPFLLLIMALSLSFSPSLSPSLSPHSHHSSSLSIANVHHHDDDHFDANDHDGDEMTHHHDEDRDHDMENDDYATFNSIILESNGYEQNPSPSSSLFSSLSSFYNNNHQSDYLYSLLSSTAVHQSYPDNCPSPPLPIITTPTNTIIYHPPYLPLYLSIMATPASCLVSSAYKVLYYIWRSDNNYDTNSIISTQNTIIYPPYSLLPLTPYTSSPPSTHLTVYVYDGNNTLYSSSYTYTIYSVLSYPLYAYIDGGSTQTVQSGVAQTVNGGKSYDPNGIYALSQLVFTWKCINVADNNNYCTGSSGIGMSTLSVNLPVGTFNISLLLSTPLPSSPTSPFFPSSFSSILLSTILPTLPTQPFLSLSISSPIVNVNDQNVVVTSTIQPDTYLSGSSYLYRWGISKGNINGNDNDDVNTIQSYLSSLPLTLSTLTLSSLYTSVVLPGTIYSITLSLSSSASNTSSVYFTSISSSVSFYVNIPPTQCVLSYDSNVNGNSSQSMSIIDVIISGQVGKCQDTDSKIGAAAVLLYQFYYVTSSYNTSLSSSSPSNSTVSKHYLSPLSTTPSFSPLQGIFPPTTIYISCDIIDQDKGVTSVILWNYPIGIPNKPITADIYQKYLSSFPSYTPSSNSTNTNTNTSLNNNMVSIDTLLPYLQTSLVLFTYNTAILSPPLNSSQINSYKYSLLSTLNTYTSSTPYTTSSSSPMDFINFLLTFSLSGGEEDPCGTLLSDSSDFSITSTVFSTVNGIMEQVVSGSGNSIIGNYPINTYSEDKITALVSSIFQLMICDLSSSSPSPSRRLLQSPSSSSLSTPLSSILSSSTTLLSTTQLRIVGDTLLYTTTTPLAYQRESRRISSANKNYYDTYNVSNVEVMIPPNTFLSTLQYSGSEVSVGNSNNNLVYQKYIDISLSLYDQYYLPRVLYSSSYPSSTLPIISFTTLTLSPLLSYSSPSSTSVIPPLSIPMISLSPSSLSLIGPSHILLLVPYDTTKCNSHCYPTCVAFDGNTNGVSNGTYTIYDDQNSMKGSVLCATNDYTLPIIIVSSSSPPLSPLSSLSSPSFSPSTTSRFLFTLLSPLSSLYSPLVILSPDVLSVGILYDLRYILNMDREEGYRRLRVRNVSMSSGIGTGIFTYPFEVVVDILPDTSSTSLLSSTLYSNLLSSPSSTLSTTSYLSSIQLNSIQIYCADDQYHYTSCPSTTPPTPTPTSSSAVPSASSTGLLPIIIGIVAGVAVLIGAGYMYYAYKNKKCPFRDVKSKQDNSSNNSNILNINPLSLHDNIDIVSAPTPVSSTASSFSSYIPNAASPPTTYHSPNRNPMVFSPSIPSQGTKISYRQTTLTERSPMYPRDNGTTSSFSSSVNPSPLPSPALHPQFLSPPHSPIITSTPTTRRMSRGSKRNGTLGTAVGIVAEDRAMNGAERNRGGKPQRGSDHRKDIMKGGEAKEGGGGEREGGELRKMRKMMRDKNEEKKVRREKDNFIYDEKRRSTSPTPASTNDDENSQILHGDDDHDSRSQIYHDSDNGHPNNKNQRELFVDEISLADYYTPSPSRHGDDEEEDDYDDPNNPYDRERERKMIERYMYGTHKGNYNMYNISYHDHNGNQERRVGGDELYDNDKSIVGEYSSYHPHHHIRNSVSSVLAPPLPTKLKGKSLSISNLNQISSASSSLFKEQSKMRIMGHRNNLSQIDAVVAASAVMEEKGEDAIVLGGGRGDHYRKDSGGEKKENEQVENGKGNGNENETIVAEKRRPSFPSKIDYAYAVVDEGDEGGEYPPMSTNSNNDHVINIAESHYNTISSTYHYGNSLPRSAPNGPNNDDSHDPTHIHHNMTHDDDDDEDDYNHSIDDIDTSNASELFSDPAVAYAAIMSSLNSPLKHQANLNSNINLSLNAKSAQQLMVQQQQLQGRRVSTSGGGGVSGGNGNIGGTSSSNILDSLSYMYNTSLKNSLPIGLNVGGSDVTTSSINGTMTSIQVLHEHSTSRKEKKEDKGKSDKDNEDDEDEEEDDHDIVASPYGSHSPSHSPNRHRRPRVDLDISHSTHSNDRRSPSPSIRTFQTSSPSLIPISDKAHHSRRVSVPTHIDLSDPYDTMSNSFPKTLAASYSPSSASSHLPLSSSSASSSLSIMGNQFPSAISFDIPASRPHKKKENDDDEKDEEDKKEKIREEEEDHDNDNDDDYDNDDDIIDAPSSPLNNKYHNPSAIAIPSLPLPLSPPTSTSSSPRLPLPTTITISSPRPHAPPSPQRTSSTSTSTSTSISGPGPMMDFKYEYDVGPTSALATPSTSPMTSPRIESGSGQGSTPRDPPPLSINTNKILLHQHSVPISSSSSSSLPTIETIAASSSLDYRLPSYNLSSLPSLPHHSIHRSLPSQSFEYRFGTLQGVEALTPITPITPHTIDGGGQSSVSVSPAQPSSRNATMGGSGGDSLSGTMNGSGNSQSIGSNLNNINGTAEEGIDKKLQNAIRSLGLWRQGPQLPPKQKSRIPNASSTNNIAATLNPSSSNGHSAHGRASSGGGNNNINMATGPIMPPRPIPLSSPRHPSHSHSQSISLTSHPSSSPTHSRGNTVVSGNGIQTSPPFPNSSSFPTMDLPSSSPLSPTAHRSLPPPSPLSSSSLSPSISPYPYPNLMNKRDSLGIILPGYHQSLSAPLDVGMMAMMGGTMGGQAGGGVRKTTNSAMSATMSSNNSHHIGSGSDTGSGNSSGASSVRGSVSGNGSGNQQNGSSSGGIGGIGGKWSSILSSSPPSTTANPILSATSSSPSTSFSAPPTPAKTKSGKADKKKK